MSFAGRRAQLTLGIFCVAIIGGSTDTLARVSARHHLGASHGAAEQTRAPFSQALPPLDRDHLKATVVEVTYALGESDPPTTRLAKVSTKLPTAFIRSLPTRATKFR